MIERAAYAEALFEEKERAQVTLNSIGDAVVSTDVSGQVTYLNAVAEDLTGWSLKEARWAVPLRSVFQIIDATTRQPAQIR
jgi:PAS domain-containing protein